MFHVGDSPNGRNKSPSIGHTRPARVSGARSRCTIAQRPQQRPQVGLVALPAADRASVHRLASLPSPCRAPVPTPTLVVERGGKWMHLPPKPRPGRSGPGPGTGARGRWPGKPGRSEFPTCIAAFRQGPGALGSQLSVHGARVTAVQSGLGRGTAARQPLQPSRTQVDAPASMRTTPGQGDDFLHESLPSAWPDPMRRQDASAFRTAARNGHRLACACRCGRRAERFDANLLRCGRPPRAKSGGRSRPGDPDVPAALGDRRPLNIAGRPARR